MKERVTLTIDRDVLRSVDERVDGAQIKNRSHAVELLLRQSLRGQGLTHALILAGGRADALGVAGSGKPKALVEVNGKPLLQYNIELCKRYGIKNIILSVGHQGQEIMKHFGNGADYGVNITYLEEAEPMGTAWPLRQLMGKINSTIVVMNGDELKDVNLHKMHRHHVESDARATIALTTVEDTSRYGVALLDGSRIIRFVEKPKKEDAPSKLISAGLYMLEPDVLGLIPEGFAMVEVDMFPKLAKEGHLHGYLFSGKWFDINSQDQLDQASTEWRDLSAY